MSEWINKIKNAEVTPPENGWEKVAASLDESLNGSLFPANVYNLESDPPANIWDKIKSSLEEDETPVIPLQKQKSFPSIFKYAIAACVIGLLAVGAIRYFNIGTDKIDVAVGPVIPSSVTDSPAKSSDQSASIANPLNQNDSDEAALEQSKQVYASLDLRTRSLYHTPALLTNSFRNALYHRSLELQYPHRAAVNDFHEAAADRYLMFRNSAGDFVRISKKLSDLFCCVSGEQQDENCTDQLKKWREKIATSSFIPSPDNFMDILDLVTSLDDPRN